MPKVKEPELFDQVDQIVADAEGAAPVEDDGLGPAASVSITGMSSVAVPDETSLALDEEPSGAVSPFQFSDTLDFSPDDVALPRLRLLQGLSPEVQDGLGSPGQWIVPGYPAMKSATFVPVGLMKRRELRNAERIVICSSQDAKVGVGQPGGDCATCPMAQWRPNPNGNGKNSPPPCSLIYSFLGIIEENEEVCVLDLQKTATAAAKFINTMAFRRAALGGFGTFGIKLDSVKQQGNNNSWFVPKPSLAMIEPDRLKTLVAIARPA